MAKRAAERQVIMWQGGSSEAGNDVARGQLRGRVMMWQRGQLRGR